MNVLSLFDGMSCGQIAMNKIGMTPNKYYAAEIDKYAVQVCKANYPNTIHLGDVENWREWDIEWSEIDLLIGGSPCQGFSFAGKQLAFDDPRSKLFFVFVDILNHIKSLNPDLKFMLENVKMKKEYMEVITEQLGVEPVFINSNKCSPCDRPRFYWANWHIPPVENNNISFLECVSDWVLMKDGWNKWWNKNKEFQTKKCYSKIPKVGEKGITMTARQYASWNGNFINTPDGIAKPGKKTLAKLIGAKDDYFESVTQRQAELMTGNGWTVDVIAHIFSHMNSQTKEREVQLQLAI